jgi:hypothetical protein
MWKFNFFRGWASGKNAAPRWVCLVNFGIQFEADTRMGVPAPGFAKAGIAGTRDSSGTRHSIPLSAQTSLGEIVVRGAPPPQPEEPHSLDTAQQAHGHYGRFRFRQVILGLPLVTAVLSFDISTFK